MTAMAQLYKDIRSLIQRSEEVSEARRSGTPTDISNATVCRNDVVLSIELSFSALVHENANLKQRITRLEGLLHDRKTRE